MALVTAQDFIQHAFRRCGQMRPGYTLPPELLNDGMNEWQLLFDEWQAQRAMGFSVPDYLYAVNGPGSQSNGNGYLIGPTAHTAPANPPYTNAGGANDFQGPRPTMIVRANCVMTNTGPQPVYIPMKAISAEEWASLSIRQIPAINVTSLFYYDPQFPNGVFNVFPPMQGNSIELFTSPVLFVPASLSTAYSAPPGYADAVVKSLAERLWPLVTKDMAPNKLPFATVAGYAENARLRIWTLNRPIPRLPGDFRSGSKPDGYYDSLVSWSGEPY